MTDAGRIWTEILGSLGTQGNDRLKGQGGGITKKRGEMEDMKIKNFNKHFVLAT